MVASYSEQVFFAGRRVGSLGGGESASSLGLGFLDCPSVGVGFLAGEPPSASAASLAALTSALAALALSVRAPESSPAFSSAMYLTHFLIERNPPIVADPVGHILVWFPPCFVVLVERQYRHRKYCFPDFGSANTSPPSRRCQIFLPRIAWRMLRADTGYPAGAGKYFLPAQNAVVGDIVVERIHPLAWV